VLNDTIRADALHAELRAALAPVLKAAGFKRSRLGKSAWARAHRGEFVAFWVQCDRYGWMRELGSRFTLEFQRGASAHDLHNRLELRERFGALLAAPELEQVRDLNNAVLRSLPRISADNPVMAIRADLREALLRSYEPRREPHAPTDDIWLHYYTHEQIGEWAAFLAARIVPMTDRFAAATDLVPAAATKH
jgi:hypothetical protein